MDPVRAQYLFELTTPALFGAVNDYLGSNGALLTPALTALAARETLRRFDLNMRVIACEAYLLSGSGDNLVDTQDQHLLLVGGGFYYAPLIGVFHRSMTGEKLPAYLAGAFATHHRDDDPFQVRFDAGKFLFKPLDDQISWMTSPDTQEDRWLPIARSVLKAVAAA